MTQPRKFKVRWRVLIYPNFQLRLLVINGFVMILSFLLTAVLSFRSYENLKSMGLASNLPSDHLFFRFLKLQFDSFFLHLSAAFGLSILLTSIVTLLLSHRLAGPIVRLKSFFKHIADRGLNPSERLSFRKGDFFSDLPAAVNQALDKIRGKS